MVSDSLRTSHHIFTPPTSMFSWTLPVCFLRLRFFDLFLLLLKLCDDCTHLLVWELDCTMLRQTKYLYTKNKNKIENGLLWTRVTLASVTFSKDKVVEYRLQRHKACSTPHNLLLCAVCFWVRISSNPNLNVWCAFMFSDIFRVVFVLYRCTCLCVCVCVGVLVFLRFLLTAVTLTPKLKRLCL